MRVHRLAPALSRVVKAAGPDPAALYMRHTGARSMRGVEAVTTVETLEAPASSYLPGIARLPRLTHLILVGAPDVRRVRLQGLLGASRLHTLRLESIRGRLEGIETLAALPALRVLDVHMSPAPALRALPRGQLERLELDSASRVDLRGIEGMTLRHLDLWGCEVANLEPLAGLSRLEEVWLFGNPIRSLAPLIDLPALKRVVFDGHLDPEVHRAAIEALEARGVWVFASHDPHGHGVAPSWWAGGPASTPEAPIRYQTPGIADPARS